MPIKFRNRYIVGSLKLKDGTPGLAKSVTRQTILTAVLDTTKGLFGDVGVGRVKASLAVKDINVVGSGSGSGGGSDRVLFMMRVDRATVREVRLALTCLTSLEMRTASVRVVDVGGGVEQVKDRYGRMLVDGGMGEEEVRRVLTHVTG